MSNQDHIPTGWVKTTVGESLSQVISGSGFPKQYQGQLAGEFPFAKVGDISRSYRKGDKYISEAQHYLDEDVRSKIKAKIFPESSIVFPKIGEALKGNYRVISKRKMLFDNNVMGVVSANGILVDFLYYFLMTQDFGRFSVATAVPSVRRGDIEAIQLLLPPTNEQHRIVAKIEELFSELDKGIESLKTAREQLKVYRQALLKHAFEGKLTEQWRKDNADKLETADQLLERIKQEREARYQQQLEDWKAAVKQWEADGKEGKKPTKPAKLKTIDPVTDQDLVGLEGLPSGWVYAKFGELIEGSQNGLSKRSGKSGTETVVLRLADIDQEEVDLSDTRSILLTEDEQQKYLLKKDDLLCIRVNGSPELVGRYVLIREEGALAYCDHFIRYRPLLSLSDSGYLKYYFNTRYVRRYVDLNKVSSAGQNTVNQDTMGSILVAYCGIEEQQAIISILEEKLSVLDSLDSSMSEQLKKSEALRQSILKKAFSGQLVPQDPDDEPASVLLDRIAKEKEQAAAKDQKAKAAKKKPKTTKKITRKAS